MSMLSQAAARRIAARLQRRPPFSTDADRAQRVLEDLDRRLDHIDASVFSGELLHIDKQRELFKGYIERWRRALAEHAGSDRADTSAVAYLMEPTNLAHPLTRPDVTMHRPVARGDWKITPLVRDTALMTAYAEGRADEAEAARAP